jgi:hypothetical protein
MTRLLQTTEVLNEHQSKQHLAHTFLVPDGATELAVGFSYRPPMVEGQPGRNLLSLSLFDPNGSRGAGHNRADNNIRLNAAHATPGYVPGPLPPGQWQLVVDTHMVLPGAPPTYQLTIDVSFDPITDKSPDYTKGITPPRGAGWYRGDLHAHTIHSDGHWDVPDLVAAARANGLDFVTLSDHNTIAPLAQMDSLSAPNLLTMGGLELTTYAGHALALGLREWIDWRVCPPAAPVRTMQDIAAVVEAAGGLFVIAHPMSPGDPVCTGCDWQYADMMPGTAHVVEVWNGEWSDYNEDGLALWYRWLNQGHRLVATSGTDAHGPPLSYDRVGFDVVYAESLSETAILGAIRQGHLYLSADNCHVKLKGQTENAQGIVGDTLHGTAAQIEIEWGAPAAGDVLRLVADGQLVETITLETAGTHRWTFSIDHPTWRVVEWRDRQGRMRALTNPIFFHI